MKKLILDLNSGVVVDHQKYSLSWEEIKKAPSLKVKKLLIGSTTLNLNTTSQKTPL